MTRSEIRAAIDRYVDAHNAHSADALVDCFTPDAVVIEPVGATPNVGHDEIRVFMDKAAQGGYRVALHNEPTIVGLEAAFVLAISLLDGDGQPTLTFLTTDVASYAPDGKMTRCTAYIDIEATAPGAA